MPELHNVLSTKQHTNNGSQVKTRLCARLQRNKKDYNFSYVQSVMLDVRIFFHL